MCFQTVFIAVVVAAFVLVVVVVVVVVVIVVDFVAFFVWLLLAFCSALFFKSYLNRFYMRETVFKYEMITFL